MPAVGGRNLACFSLAGHLLSLVGDSGDRLNEAEVLAIVESWAFANGAQPREGEIAKAVASAARNGTRREAKFPEPIVTEEYDGVDLSGLLSKPETKAVVAELPRLPKANFEPAEPSSSLRIPRECMKPPGILSEIIDYTLRTSLFPQPELALAGAIALLATVTGRKLTDDKFKTRTNLYVLGLAPSGAGKGQARETNETLLGLCNACDGMLGPERIGSSAGLTSWLNLRSPATLLQLDEISRLFETTGSGKTPHLYNVPTVLMQLYSKSGSNYIGEAYANIDQVPTINQPHAVIYGTACPENFWESMTVDSVSDGFLGRFLPFESADGYVDPVLPEDIEPSESLIKSIAWWCERDGAGGNLSKTNPRPVDMVVAKYTPEALERITGFMLAIAKKRKTEDSQAAALWSRASDKATKLALIFAASRCPRAEVFFVELEDVHLAIQLVNWMTRMILEKARDHISWNQQEELSKRVMRLITKPLTKTEITRKTQWLKRRDRDEIIASLIEGGYLEMAEHNTGGRPRIVYQKPSANSLEIA